MWNYLQGGDDNLALDRTAGDALISGFPDITYLARQARRFLMRAVRFVAEVGDVHQFLDLGCGLPAPNDLCNVHEVAQSVHPDAQVVYVDNDKVVISYADALLTGSTTEGTTAYVEADIHHPAQIITEAAEALDFSKPIAVIMLGVLGHVPDHDEACSIVDEFMAAVPVGSYLIAYDGFNHDQQHSRAVAQRNKTGIDPYHLRTIEEFRRYFDGLELVPPGIGPVTGWRPERSAIGTLRTVPSHSGVARKVGR
jgi:hypothetical protein